MSGAAHLPAPKAATPKLPAVKRKPRHNEWTRAKMAEFLRELAATQNVAVAAKNVGMSRASAYALRNRLKGTPFDLGWEVALEMGFTQLAHAVMDRAINGVEQEHYYHGQLIGTSRKYDNRLAQYVLNNPWKIGRAQAAREYAAGSFDRLLERIEAAGLDWETGEAIPGQHVEIGTPVAEAEAAENAFISHESWYLANTGLDNGPGGGSSKRRWGAR